MATPSRVSSAPPMRRAIVEVSERDRAVSFHDGCPADQTGQPMSGTT